MIDWGPVVDWTVLGLKCFAFMLFVGILLGKMLQALGDNDPADE